MKIKFVEGKCQNCNKEIQTTVDINAGKMYDKNDLKNFASYKNTGLSVCPICNFVALDVTKESNDYLKQKNKVKYDYYYNYQYLPSLSDIERGIFESFAPNDYECYAKCLISGGDSTNGIRFMYRAIEIKKNVIKALENMKLQDYEDDDILEIKNINKVIKELNDSIVENQKEIYYAYSGQKDVFTLAMYILTIKDLGLTEKATKLVDEISNLDILPNLLDYLKSKVV